MLNNIFLIFKYIYLFDVVHTCRTIVPWTGIKPVLPVVERQSPDHWTPWKKNHDRPGQHIEKQKHYFANKVCLVKAMVFPVVMFECESWNCESWNSNTLATWCEELTHLKRPWCWVRLKAGGEEHNRRWDGRMASSTQWTLVWASSRSWWWTG